MNPKKITSIIALGFLIDNLIWLYFFSGLLHSQPNIVPALALNTETSLSHNGCTAEKIIPKSFEYKTFTNNKFTDTVFEQKLRPPAQSSATSEAVLKSSENEEASVESGENTATFFGSEEQKKLEIIEKIPAHGEGLKFLDDVLRIDNNSIVKIAAINRLHQEHSDATVSLLIRVLDDPAPEVSVIALNTLISSGDPALIPVLTEKMHVLPEGTIKNFYAESLQRLDMNISMGMGMDNLTQQ